MLAEPDETNGTPETEAGRDVPAAPDWQARCEILQARIEALEHQVEALMVTPRTSGPLVPERRHDFGPISREHLSPAESEERREIFRPEPPTDAAVPGVAEIGILVTAGDAAARQLAETLTGILAGAGWKVRGVTEAPVVSCRGLTLAAAPTLPLQRVTSTLNALREAGLAMTFQLDPERGPSETVMIVGAGAELTS